MRYNRPASPGLASGTAAQPDQQGRGHLQLIDADDLRPEPWRPFRWFVAHPRSIDWIVIVLGTVPQLIALVFRTGAFSGVGIDGSNLDLNAASAGMTWPIYVTVVGTGLALFWRRSFPMTALAVIAVLGVLAPVGFQTIPSAFALYAVAVRSSLPRSLAGYVIAVGAPLAILTGHQLVGVAVQTLNNEPLQPTILEPFALIALTIGIVVRNRAQQREVLSQVINQRIESARVSERTRITAEMHDVVAHSLSVMIALANGAAAGWNKHPERSAEALTQLSAVGRTALLDMQRILHLLRDDEADDPSRTNPSAAAGSDGTGYDLPTINELALVFRAAGLPVTLTTSGEPLPDDAVLRLTIYRIAQEALTNSLRYASSATTVVLAIDRNAGMVTVTVTDDGPGRDIDHSARHPSGLGVGLGSGRGLVGIRERAGSFDGTSEAGPIPGGGWRTSAVLRLTPSTPQSPQNPQSPQSPPKPPPRLVEQTGDSDVEP